MAARGDHKRDHQQLQPGQQTRQAFDQHVPDAMSRAVYQLEQLETDAERAHGQAMRLGDAATASTLADVTQIAYLQKKLLLHQSVLAQTVGQSTRQSFEQCEQQLQQSQAPGAQHVAHLLQQLSRSTGQAISEGEQLSQPRVRRGRRGVRRASRGGLRRATA